AAPRARTAPAQSRESTAGTEAAKGESWDRVGNSHARWQGWGSFPRLQLCDCFLGGNFTIPQSLQNFGAGRRWIGVNKLQLAGNSVEAGLDGRVADSENLFHFLDRAVRAQK